MLESGTGTEKVQASTLLLDTSVHATTQTFELQVDILDRNLSSKKCIQADANWRELNQERRKRNMALTELGWQVEIIQS